MLWHKPLVCCANMKVLWISGSPSLYDEQTYGGWVSALERIVRKYCPQIELGITFEHTDDKFKEQRDNVTYYPLKVLKTVRDIWKMKWNGNDDWYLKGPLLHRVIDDFKPDIIQCFGSEWNWGLISKETDVPVVIHMQGFRNIYAHASKQVNIASPSILYDMLHPREVLQRLFLKTYSKKECETEIEIMKSCRFFMGRTEWDKNLVKYFGVDAEYFYCPEAIRPEIYESKERWSYKQKERLQIVTIASAGQLKGNGVILETAKLLKDMGVKFEWRVSGDKMIINSFERSTKINHKDVNVTLLGFVPVTEVKNELLKADIYVLPSIIDNSPNSLCEAQLIGCPVVATYVGGVPQIVQNGETGILYPYNEPHTLAYTLLKLYEHPERLIELSKKEVAVSHDRHNPQIIARTLQDIYMNILKQ